MTADIPKLEEFVEERVKTFNGGDIQKANKAFEFNMRAAVQSLLRSDELKVILAALASATHSYSADHPELLFSTSDVHDKVRILSKSFTSTMEKLYRQNVLFNKKFPEPPSQGFLEILDVYENIDDLLRTRLVCKYMDGPEHVCKTLEEACKASGIQCKFKDVGTDAGYYAWHFYFRFPAELMLNDNILIKQIWVEFQVTTQLAEVITILTHQLYEERRSGGSRPSSKWKWDANSNRFRSAYLGHGLHLLEGIIQALKDDIVGAIKQPPEEGSNPEAKQASTEPAGALIQEAEKSNAN